MLENFLQAMTYGSIGIMSIMVFTALILLGARATYVVYKELDCRMLRWDKSREQRLIIEEKERGDARLKRSKA